HLSVRQPTVAHLSPINKPATDQSTSRASQSAANSRPAASKPSVQSAAAALHKISTKDPIPPAAIQSSRHLSVRQPTVAHLSPINKPATDQSTSRASQSAANSRPAASKPSVQSAAAALHKISTKDPIPPASHRGSSILSSGFNLK
ncbi:hypothetical protein L249_4509, partial [Ophiocordyceps polyrhachis-furcata BCC 54312]